MPKSLKEQNRWQLWLVIAANALFLYGVIQANAVFTSGFDGLLKDAARLAPMGFAVVIATALNGVLPTDAKERLVFLRWNHALPGHRAFSEYAMKDPRIDVERLRKILGEFPVDPVEQNRFWYRACYKNVETVPAVMQVHKDFLLMRDYTGLAALFVIFFGAAAFYEVSSLMTTLVYLGLLLIQFLIVRHSACTYGIRMVKTVLAQIAASAKNSPEPRPSTAA